MMFLGQDWGEGYLSYMGWSVNAANFEAFWRSAVMKLHIFLS